MFKFAAIILVASAFSQAAVHSFIPCVAERNQSTMKRVREALLEKVTHPDSADIVGYYELLKNRQVVGYLPFFYDKKNKKQIAEAYLCVTSGDNYYYVNGPGEDIKNWIPKAGQTIILKDLMHDEAVSHLQLTRVNNSEIKVDFFIRNLSGNREIIQDIAILSLKPKTDL